MMTETERKFTVADYILRNLFDSIDAILNEIDGDFFKEIREKLDNTEREIGEEIIKKYECLAGSFDNKIEICSKIISNLTKLRDTLLPKLLSGEIRIPEAEGLINNFDRNGDNNGSS